MAATKETKAAEAKEAEVEAAAKAKAEEETKAAESNWHKIEDMSDHLVTVEGVGVLAHQKRGAFLRFIIGGKIVKVQYIDGLLPKLIAGKTWVLEA